VQLIPGFKLRIAHDEEPSAAASHSLVAELPVAR
jgi:hypothetical protein